jgi:hypothetical protein
MTSAAMTGNKNTVFISIARWAARVLGLLISLFLLVLVIGEIAQAIQDEELSFEPESLFVIIPTIFAVVSYVLSWWNEKIGGWLLVAAYFVFSLSPTFLSAVRGEGVQLYLSIFLISSPFLVAGILFLVSDHLSRFTAR